MTNSLGKERGVRGRKEIFKEKPRSNGQRKTAKLKFLNSLTYHGDWQEEETHTKGIHGSSLAASR